ncbi:Pimeloyl-ACP methyl ester carboxylesterase [Haloarchaeobius iranensis]|uniref:Pimeloyl-ACP methyl ester carboxylesterase n=2 Tax=Haloarchaeobius iranensis TaxID=996166 RepID=A0A1G9YPY8_9EURY|nr:Pimeloyl-ACP methyl ester carboxylesterase [Haloarchaeobius iranensis]
MVLLHGDSIGKEYWDAVIPHLEGDYELTVSDRRGRGRSGDSEAYSLQREVEDARAVIRSVDGKPVVFGHSFGGLQAIEAAREVPVSAVVAYEPAILVGEYREEADLASRMQERLDAGDREGAMKHHVAEVIHGGSLSGDALDAWLEEWPVWPEYVRFVENSVRMNRALENYELPETAELDAPALMLTGTESPSHLRDGVRAANETVVDSRLVEFDGLSHMGPNEDPDRVVDAVRSFLETVDGQQPST